MAPNSRLQTPTGRSLTAIKGNPIKPETSPVDAVGDLIDRFRLAIREQAPDDAQRLLDELTAINADVAARPVYQTMMALARGDAVSALRALQNCGEAVDELRAICLHALGDPTWEGLAESIAEGSGDPIARQAMCKLLGREARAA